MAEVQPTVTDESPWYVKLLKLNPALIRAALVAVLAVVAQVVGHTVVSDDLVNTILNAFTAISPLLAGWFIRPAVTPNAKVEAFQPDPVKAPGIVVAGEAASVPTGDPVAPVGSDAVDIDHTEDIEPEEDDGVDLADLDAPEVPQPSDMSDPDLAGEPLNVNPDSIEVIDPTTGEKL